MRLTSAFVNLGLALSKTTETGPERGGPERYLYERPICESIQQCVGINGCNGKLYTKQKGSISVGAYEEFFNCRWEIRGSPGNQIKVKVLSGESFGIENHKACGYDKIILRSYDDKGYGRLCSSKADAQLPYNGMSPQESDGNGGVKIQSSAFRDGVILDTHHLVIGFDADQQVGGIKFSNLAEISQTQPENFRSKSDQYF